MKDLSTLKDLLEYLSGCSDEQLEQPIQVADVHETNLPVVTSMLPVIAIGTMTELQFEAARSVTDNKFHGEQIVFLTDHNPWGCDGAIYYDIYSKRVNLFKKVLNFLLGKKNKVSEVKVSEVAVYGQNGPTAIKDQLNPNIKWSEDQISEFDKAILKSRSNRLGG